MVEKEKGAQLQKECIEAKDAVQKMMGKGREYAKGLGEAYTKEKMRMMGLEAKLGTPCTVCSGDASLWPDPVFARVRAWTLP